MKFREYLENLEESPIAFRGNLPNKHFTTRISKTVIDLQWNLIGTLKIGSKILEVRNLQKESDTFYIVGEFFPDLHNDRKNAFGVYCWLELKDLKKYKTVQKIITAQEMRGKDIATELYKFLVNKEKVQIISGAIQFFGARKLWAKLSREAVVDVIDIKTNKVLEKNVLLKHGESDEDFDKKYYGDSENGDFTKDNIRFLLKDVK